MAESRRARAARKGWETRRAREAERDAERRAHAHAAKRGWVKRRARDAGADVLARFLSAREAGESHQRINRAHTQWLSARRALKNMLDEDEWGDVLQSIGDELGLDEDFIEALEESPDEGAS